MFPAGIKITFQSISKQIVMSCGGSREARSFELVNFQKVRNPIYAGNYGKAVNKELCFRGNKVCLVCEQSWVRFTRALIAVTFAQLIKP